MTERVELSGNPDLMVGSHNTLGEEQKGGEADLGSLGGVDGEGEGVFMTPRRTDPVTSPTHGGWV